jgi:lysophospholipase L1-like esterase
MMSILATMSRKKQILFTIVTVVSALVLMEVAARIFLRVWPDAGYRDPSDSPPLPLANSGTDNYFTEAQFRVLREREGLAIDLAPDEARGWTMTPGSYFLKSEISTGVALIRINSHGFRGPALATKEPHELRIMAIGDSTIFGYGVREDAAMTSVAARRLSKALSRPVVPIVAATPGYDTGQCLDTLLAKGAQVEPDVVVIASLWSDLSPAHFDPTIGRTEELPALGISDTTWKPLKRLALYRVMDRFIGTELGTRKVGFLGDLGNEAELGLHPPRITAEDFRTNLLAMHDAAQNLGAMTLFVSLPAPIDFSDAPPLRRIADYRQVIEDVAQQTGSLFLDGPTEFKKRGGRLSFFLDQVHPAAEGHTLLGEAISDLLEPLLTSP